MLGKAHVALDRKGKREQRWRIEVFEINRARQVRWTQVERRMGVTQIKREGE